MYPYHGCVRGYEVHIAAPKVKRLRSWCNTSSTGLTRMHEKLGTLAKPTGVSPTSTPRLRALWCPAGGP